MSLETSSMSSLIASLFSPPHFHRCASACMCAWHEYILIIGKTLSLAIDSWVLLRKRILPRYCVFKTCKIYKFDTPVLGQFLSDFVRVKNNVFSRLSTSTYPRKILTTPKPKAVKNTLCYWPLGVQKIILTGDGQIDDVINSGHFRPTDHVGNHEVI